MSPYLPVTPAEVASEAIAAAAGAAIIHLHARDPENSRLTPPTHIHAVSAADQVGMRCSCKHYNQGRSWHDA